MSSESRPITSAQFTAALTDLPLENIYAKAFEIRNSIAHLERSNTQLQEYSESLGGDADCLEAIHENKIVIERQEDRIGLLKDEVERRGGRWHDAGSDADSKRTVNGTEDVEMANGSGATTSTGSDHAAGRRLTDEELRRQMEARLAEDEDEQQGMHL